MKMRKFLLTVGLVLTMTVCAFSAALAANPEDALSSRPEKSVSMVLKVDDLGGFLRWALSEGNMKIFAPLAGLDDDAIAMVTGILAGVPVKAAALSVGMTEEMTPFFQAAIAGPEAANVGEFILGAGNPMAPMVESILTDSGIAFEMKDGFLLLGMTADDVKAGTEALDDEGKRMVLNRRGTTQDFALFHTDFDVLKQVVLMDASDDDARKEAEESFKNVYDVFKAPLNVELGFQSLADRFLVAVGMNLREAMTEKYAKTLDDAQPAAGGHLKLFGEGSPMLALGSKMNVDMFKEQPSIKEGWDEAMKGLNEEIGLTEQDIIDLLSGGFSLALGGASVSIEGIGVPAAYLIVDGVNGVAAKVLGIAEQQAKALLNPIQADGWDKMYQVDTSVTPVPCLTGTQGETLFVGMLDAAALASAPAPAEKLAELLGKDSIGSMWLDFEAIRVYLKDVFDGPLGAMLALPALGEIIGEETAGAMSESIKDVLNAKLSVPSMSAWGSDCETFFLDFANVEIQPEEGLLAKLVKAYQAFENLSGSGEENKD